MQKKQIGLIAFVSVMVVLLVILVVKLFHDSDKQKMYTEVAEEVKVSKKVKKNQHEVDFSKLKKENSDIFAWIKVDGMKIDYPVLMSSGDKDTDYYLLHNLDHSDGRPGCLYVQKEQARDFSNTNTIIYGHNMYNNGTMFNPLIQMQDEAFFNEHTKFTIETETQRLTYKIWAAVQFSDDHLLYKYDFQTDVGKNQFISAITSVRDMYSHVNPDVKVDETSKLVTLSTCMTKDSTHRYLVIGVLDKTVDLED
ncbi:MAG: class B sortase [Lachnospiraceae bacterium]|nr:class B sortase [Lachnospiraceae bacterium]